MKTLFIHLAVFSQVALAAEEVLPRIQWGLFVDTFYAYDSNRPASRERLFTTLPTRHNEFALNLAYLEAKVSAAKWRARLALQTGTSVNANYASEIRDKSKTGMQLADYASLIQEAYAGYFVADKVWVDAGIYFSHIGSESFISRDNPTYTRSLVADFSPYYQAGVRASYQLNPQWAFQLHLINGWQNIIENNEAKSVGTQISFSPSPHFSVTYNTVLGDEAAFRTFHDLIIRYAPTNFWELTLVGDLGTQEKAALGSTALWGGTALVQKFTFDAKSRIGVRAEYYQDRHGVIVPTGTARGFQAWGGSINYDYQLTAELLFRNELRYQRAIDAIYPARGANQPETLFGVSSLALSL